MVVAYLEIFMPALACIAITKPDWVTFHKVTEKLFGRSMIAPLDSQKISTTTPTGFVAALAQMTEEKPNPLQAIRNLGRLGRHASVTFLYMGDQTDVLLINLYSDLLTTETEDRTIYVISGTLEQWQSSLIKFAALESVDQLKGFAFLVMQQFDTLGMGHLWEDYSRKTSHHGLILARK